MVIILVLYYTFTLYDRMELFFPNLLNCNAHGCSRFTHTCDTAVDTYNMVYTVQRVPIMNSLERVTSMSYIIRVYLLLFYLPTPFVSYNISYIDYFIQVLLLCTNIYVMLLLYSPTGRVIGKWQPVTDSCPRMCNDLGRLYYA